MGTRNADSTLSGRITCQRLAGLLCGAPGAPGKRSAFLELVLSMLKMAIIHDGWSLLVLAGVLGKGVL